jgi:hypothetical protein
MTSLVALFVSALVALHAPPSTEPAEANAWAEADRLSSEGRHEEAASAYAVAFEREGAVAILYSWAQAERLSGDCTRALELYERFLAEGETLPPEYETEVMRARWSDMRANAERQQDACRRALEDVAEEPPSVDPSPPPPAVALEPTSPPPPSRATPPRDLPSRERWRRDPVGWSLVGVGAAALATGGALVGVAAWRDDRAEGSGTHQDFLDEVDRALLEQRIGIGLLAAGGAIAVAGAVRLAIVGRGRRDRPVALRVSPGVGVLGRF